MVIATDILDMAMDLELKSVEFYSTLARQTAIEAVSNVFRFLSGQEKAHYEIVKAWRDNIPAPVLQSETILVDSDKIFKNLSEHFSKADDRALNYYQAYEQALLFEEQSVHYYRRLLGKSDDGRKAIIMRIIDQEKSHARFIKNLMEFLRHPGEWLENAEWHHLDEY
jgi:rubrerythrin